MKRTIVLLAAAMVVAGTQGSGQSPGPNFSGSWILDGQKSVSPEPRPPVPSDNGPSLPPPAPPPPRTKAITIVQTPTELRLDRTMERGGEPIVQTFVYKLDGSTSTNQSGPIVSTSTASWDGRRLVISTAYTANGNPIGESREEYRMEGSNLVVDGTRTTRAGTMVSKSVFFRADRAR